MDRLLQQFEAPVRDKNGDTYVVSLFGRSREGDAWQGWLTFDRQRDGRRFTTPVETTQSNAEAVLYWATGLTDAYFEGALARAMSPSPMPQTTAATDGPPLVARAVDHATRAERLTHIERDVLDVFATRRENRVLTQTLFDTLPHAHADIVRALEDLEKQQRLVERRTEEGNDWVFLTG